MKMLVLGGCRSGKSGFAEQIAGKYRRRCYVATLAAGYDDAEMRQRIDLHREQRGAGWQTVEEPRALLAALKANAPSNDVLLVDCLTMWLTNLLLAELDDEAIRARVRELASGLAAIETAVVLVANEVGLGLVPDNPLGRRFRDLAGWTNQQLAAACDQVVFVAAGLPLILKGGKSIRT